MSPQVNPILENAPVRPPPGFQSSGPPPVLPPAPYSASPHPAPMLPMDSYAVLHNNQGNMQMPQASPFQSSMAPPGFQSNQMSSPVPQTRNPFAQPTYPNGLHQQSRFSQSFGMNGMAGANNHLSSGNTLLPSFLQPPQTSLEQNGNIDLDSDQHDRFGLRSLGIFSDESSYTKPLPETRNPFAFDWERDWYIDMNDTHLPWTNAFLLKKLDTNYRISHHRCRRHRSGFKSNLWRLFAWNALILYLHLLWRDCYGDSSWDRIWLISWFGALYLGWNWYAKKRMAWPHAVVIKFEFYSP